MRNSITAKISKKASYKTSIYSFWVVDITFISSRYIIFKVNFKSLIGNGYYISFPGMQNNENYEYPDFQGKRSPFRVSGN